MACLIAPATVAIVTSSVAHKVDSKYHLDWLNAMLWGGVLMLIVEHIAHGEIVPFPPFLTAMNNPADIPVMLGEIATIGTSMTLVIIATWVVMVAVANRAEKLSINKATTA